MGLDALLENQLDHWQKFQKSHIHSFSTQRGRNWVYLHTLSTPMGLKLNLFSLFQQQAFWRCGTISKTPFLFCPRGQNRACFWSTGSGFWNTGSISLTVAQWTSEKSSILTPWGRRTVYVQLLELWPMAKFHTMIWQFWKSASISETADHTAKISSNSTPPGVERECMWDFWNFSQWPSWFSSRASRPFAFQTSLCS